jgi:hypothetical protein
MGKSESASKIFPTTAYCWSLCLSVCPSACLVCIRQCYVSEGGGFFPFPSLFIARGKMIGTERRGDRAALVYG